MKWIKIRKVKESANKIYLPYDLMSKIPKEVNVRFGQREVTALFQPIVWCSNKKNQFDNPIIVECSESILDELLILDLMVYQMTLSKGVINIGPVVGIFLGEQQYFYHNRRLKEITDSMGIYEKVGGLFYVFKASSIDWEEMCIYGLYFDYAYKQWKYGKFPMPFAIFRRTFQTKEKDIYEFNKNFPNIKIFNSIKYDKWELYNVLKNNNKLNCYLPRTQRLVDIHTLKKFLAKHPRIILKPTKLSRGRGICMLDKTNKNSIVIFDCRDKKNQKATRLKLAKLESFLHENKFFARNYIMQNYIELAKINNSPFDIRVVMQKNEKNKWECSGIECRVAGSDSLLTNVARGGQVMPIIQALQLSFGPAINPIKVKKEIISIGMEFCKWMDETGGHFGEFGLDLALDTKKNYWFIEANARPTFKGFKIMDYNNYLHICYNPILYATFISGFEKEGKTQ